MITWELCAIVEVQSSVSNTVRSRLTVTEQVAKVIPAVINFGPCVGLGCSVSYFLIYDVATKSKNFFGTFRNNESLELFDFLNDSKVDYVSKTFNGDAHGSSPMEFIYELYSREANGNFTEQKDDNGRAYQIKHITYPNDSTKTEELEEHWIK
ncbi:hypothetical protein [Pseudochryseolinea flava]|uniref:Uncharacterized protein n=1 Tax=Pseudochryseolinea flava TaxID=2059302 RepID=A0A364XY15_9BACT|nr:hypothetical protein [Pseudochryseolinea flava]RAV99157.1 hypothetical protein DQQ10_19850 [Pseudochryseolinea flava]